MADYEAALRRLATNCQFGEFLTQALRSFRVRVVQRICLTPPAVRKGLNSHQSHGACSRHGGGREQCEGAQRNGTSHPPIGPPNYRANKDAVYSLWTKEPYASRLLLQRRKVQCLWENRTHFHGLSTARICMAIINCLVQIFMNSFS